MWAINRFLTKCYDAVFSVMVEWPGWLSLTVLAGVTGVIALVAYKYTSNQDAIGRVRDDIKANLLALKLFKDNLSVTFRSQGRLFLAGVKLFLYSLQPFAVMIIPMVLLIVQMSLRYEWRPLQPGEVTVLSVKLHDGTAKDLDKVELNAPDGVIVEAGPCRVFDPAEGDEPEHNEVVWRVRPTKEGRHELQVNVNDATVTKELNVSNTRYARVSPLRPGDSFWDKLLFPTEKPADDGDVIQKVSAEFPIGESPVFGWNVHWIITYFIASIVIALLIKPFLNVKI